jgi:hypothetical protein
VIRGCIWKSGILLVILDRLEALSSEVRAGLANAWKANVKTKNAGVSD